MLQQLDVSILYLEPVRSPTVYMVFTAGWDAHIPRGLKLRLLKEEENDEEVEEERKEIREEHRNKKKEKKDRKKR